MGFALDLDGVVWLGHEPIAGAAEAVASLRAAGHDLVFCTNSSMARVGDVERQLDRLGIPAAGDVITSATAAAALLNVGERVLVCAGRGAWEAVAAAGAHPVRSGPADAVLVGLHLDFDYDRLREATVAVYGGARLLATNDDATYPTADGLIPGGGAILAAVERATGAQATIAGKPHPPMADLVRLRLGDGGVMVGDRPDTDGQFALTLGYRFALVLSGVTTSLDGITPSPDLVGADLAALAPHLLDLG